MIWFAIYSIAQTHLCPSYSILRCLKNVRFNPQKVGEALLGSASDFGKDGDGKKKN